MKHITLLLLVMAAVSPACAQFTRQWTATYNGQGDYNDRFTCMVRDGAGHYIAGGSTVNPDADRDFFIQKLDGSGNVIWSLQLDGEGHAADEVTALAITNSGNIAVVGISKGENTSEDFWTMLLTGQGDTIWTRRYDQAGEYDQPNGLAVDAAGNIIVAGLADTDISSGENDDYLTLKYDPYGNLVWFRLFNGLGDGIDRAAGVVVNNAGQIFVTGRSANGVNDDFVTISYTATGTQQWIKYDDRDDRDRASAITLDPSGNVIIAGQSSNGENDDYWVLKYGAGGNLIWQKAYDFVDDDRAQFVTTDASGNIFVSGQSDQIFGPVRNWDMATVAFSAGGSPLWVHRYDGPAAQEDFPTALLADPLGNVMVACKSDTDAGTGIDNAIVLLSLKAADGTIQWETSYQGLPNRDNLCQALASDGAGGCLAAGYAEDQTAFRNTLLLHYSQTGAALWEKQFNGAGDNNDSARLLAVDVLDNVYAAGYTVSNGDNRNLMMLRLLPDGSYGCRYVENGSAASAIDDAQGLLIADDGLPVAMGYVKNSGTSNDIYLAKFNATCDTVWDKNINGGANGSERAYDMCSDGNGHVLLTGRSDQLAGSESNDVAYTLKIRQSDGATVWIKKYDANAAAGFPERGTFVRAYNDNQIFVLGQAFNGADLDMFLIRYDGLGNQVWVQTIQSKSGDDVPVALAIDAAGNAYVLGNTGPTGQLDFTLHKFSNSGATLWASRFNGAAAGDDEAVALAIDSDGNAVVAGKSDQQSGPEVVFGIALLKFSPSGVQIWSKNVNTGAATDLSPDAMVIHPDGRILLTSHFNAGTPDQPDTAVKTFAFGQDGSELWSDTYQGAQINGSDVPNTLYLHHNDLYIGGFTEQPGAQRDMLVIKYAAEQVGAIDLNTTTASIFPNPAGDALQIRGLPATQPCTIEVSDASGRVQIRLDEVRGETTVLSLSELPQGVYFCRIVSASGWVKAEKFVHSNL